MLSAILALACDPKAPSHAKVIATAPTSAPANEAHHFGYTMRRSELRRRPGLEPVLHLRRTSDPRHPKLIKTVPDLTATAGYSGPRTCYAVPGGVRIAMLGGKDAGAPGALVKRDNDGNFLEAHPAPEYMYDVGVMPELDLSVTSSLAHPHTIKAGPAPMTMVGDAVVARDWKTNRGLQVEHLDKAPLEERWLRGAAARGGFITCAFGNSVWHWDVGPIERSHSAA